MWFVIVCINVQCLNGIGLKHRTNLVVKVTQNWSLEYKIDVCWKCKIGAQFGKFGARFCVTIFFKNVFLGQICYNFMRVTFTIDIDFVSV